MYTIAVNISSGPLALGSGDESQSAFAPFLAHVMDTRSTNLLVFRLRMMRMEIDVMGKMSRPFFVVKDHCKALAKAEARAWHDLRPGELSLTRLCWVDKVVVGCLLP